MGCGSSKTAALTPLEAKLNEAVIAAKRRAGNNIKKSSFNQLMLQFPQLRAGFLKVHNLFKQIDVNNDKYIEWSEFQSNCIALGLDQTNPALQQIYQLADMDGRHKIDAHEFVIVFTIIYLLDTEKKSAIRFPEVLNALKLLEAAFTFFDSSADGCLERAEMAAAMKSGTKVFGKSSRKSLADKLFDQLDWDGSGKVTFKEFLVGIERMVMEEPDEDEWDQDMQAGEQGDIVQPLVSHASGVVMGTTRGHSLDSGPSVGAALDGQPLLTWQSVDSSDTPHG